MPPERWTEHRDGDARVFTLHGFEVDDDLELRAFREALRAPDVRDEPTLDPETRRRHPRAVAAIVVAIPLIVFLVLQVELEVGTRFALAFALVIAVVLYASVYAGPPSVRASPATGRVHGVFELRVDPTGIVLEGGRRGPVRIALDEVDRIESGRRITVVRADGRREVLAPRLDSVRDHTALADALNDELRALRVEKRGYR